jgi:hypothetical protein
MKERDRDKPVSPPVSCVPEQRIEEGAQNTFVVRKKENGTNILYQNR